MTQTRKKKITSNALATFATITVRIPQTIFDQMIHICQEDDTTISSITRRALKEYLESVS